MERITVIADDDWDGELGELYPRVVNPAWGRVDHILDIHSLNPPPQHGRTPRPVKLTDVSMRVAERAREIVRTTSRSNTRGVKPPDAIHLASAEIHGCRDFFTYEGETTRERRGHWADVAVAEPYTENPQLDLN